MGVFGGGRELTPRLERLTEADDRRVPSCCQQPTGGLGERILRDEIALSFDLKDRWSDAVYLGHVLHRESILAAPVAGLLSTTSHSNRTHTTSGATDR